MVTDAGGLGSPSSVTVPVSIAAAGIAIVWLRPAFTAGAWFETGSTVICTWSNVVSAPSLAVSLSTYVPAVEKMARVSTSATFSNVTVPGPLTLLHVVLTSAGGIGSPSSFTVASSIASAGNVIVWSTPASTSGAVLGGSTVIVVAPPAVSAPSKALSRNWYEPGTVNDTGVCSADGFWIDAVAGPLIWIHVVVTTPGVSGWPS